MTIVAVQTKLTELKKEYNDIVSAPSKEVEEKVAAYRAELESNLPKVADGRLTALKAKIEVLEELIAEDSVPTLDTANIEVTPTVETFLK